MQPRTIILLIAATLLNGGLAFLAAVFALFATSPDMDDVTLRIGFYVVNFIAAAAVAGTVLPWLLTLWQRTRLATICAIIPLMLGCLAVLAFLTLDSWLNRTFS